MSKDNTSHAALIADSSRAIEYYTKMNQPDTAQYIRQLRDALTSCEAARENLYGEAREPKNHHHYTAVELFLKGKYSDALAMISSVVGERDAALTRAEEAEKSALLGRDNWQDAIERMAEIEIELDALRAQLTEAREQLALCAANTTAADLAQEVEHLKAELEGARGVLDGLGPVEWERTDDRGHWYKDTNPYTGTIGMALGYSTRKIRRVLPAKEADHANG